MIYHVLIIASVLSKELKTLLSKNCALLQLITWFLLQHVLFICSHKFPLVECMLFICFSVILLIANEIHPVFDNLSELDPLPPSIKHFRDQIFIIFVSVMFPTSYHFSHFFKWLFVCLLLNVIDFAWLETFIFHQIFEIVNIELMIKHLFYHRSRVIDLYHCLSDICLSFPSVKCETQTPW